MDYIVKNGPAKVYRTIFCNRLVLFYISIGIHIWYFLSLQSIQFVKKLNTVRYFRIIRYDVLHT